MCARYILDPTEYFTNRFSLEDWDKFPVTNINSAPGEILPVIVWNENQNELIHMKLGVGIKIKNKKTNQLQNRVFINIRSETVIDNYSRKRASNWKRCIIPANGFYEWDNNHKPFVFIPKDRGFISFAGVYKKSFHNNLNEESLDFAILTKDSEGIIKSVHDRSPILLDNEELEKLWLDSESDPEALVDSIKGIKNKDLEYFEMPIEINKPQNKDKNLLSKIY